MVSTPVPFSVQAVHFDASIPITSRPVQGWRFRRKSDLGIALPFSRSSTCDAFLRALPLLNAGPDAKALRRLDGHELSASDG